MTLSPLLAIRTFFPDVKVAELSALSKAELLELGRLAAEALNADLKIRGAVDVSSSVEQN